MKVALDIKNLSKLKKPTNNDVIIYDGKEWYITTKDDLLKEIQELFLKTEQKLKDIEKENNEFKQKISKDIIEIVDATKKLLTLKGDNL